MIRYFIKRYFKKGASVYGAIIILVLFNCHVKGAIVEDSSITSTVENAMSRDLAVVSDYIDVETRGGIVTLTGAQSNILAKERATSLAMEVKGVSSVINRIQVDPPFPISDEQLQTDINTILLLDPATESYKVDVKVNSGVVTLSGKLESWQEKLLCGKVVKGVYGVKDLVNRIEIVSTAERSDDDIKLEVKRRLAWDAYVDDALIDVEVKNGKVILNGTVGSASEKTRAGMVLLVEGVKSFDLTGLKVEKWARDEKFKRKDINYKSKTEIENAIKSAFSQDPRINIFDIKPEVMNDGVTVVLRGTTDNLKAKRAAIQDARNTVGIEEVINRIMVRPLNTSGENDLRSRIYDALKKDPYVRGYDVIIGTLKGVVTLRGSVGNNFEKLRIDDIVSKVKGVAMVKNKIDVQDDLPYVYNPYLEDPFIENPANRPYIYKRVISDKKIKKSIENKLWWSPFVDSDDIEVKVDDGEATLTGTVNSYTEYSIAASKAYEGGAAYVDNELTVVD